MARWPLDQGIESRPLLRNLAVPEQMSDVSEARVFLYERGSLRPFVYWANARRDVVQDDRVRIPMAHLRCLFVSLGPVCIHVVTLLGVGLV